MKDIDLNEELQKYERYDAVRYSDVDGGTDIKLLVAKAIIDGLKKLEDKLDRLVSIEYTGPSEMSEIERRAYNFLDGEAHYFVFKFRREPYEKP